MSAGTSVVVARLLDRGRDSSSPHFRIQARESEDEDEDTSNLYSLASGVDVFRAVLFFFF